MRATLGRSGLAESMCLEDAHAMLGEGCLVHFLPTHPDVSLDAGRGLCLPVVALRVSELRLPEQWEAGISPCLLTWAAGLKAEAIGRKKSCVAVKQVASLPFPFSSSVMRD